MILTPSFANLCTKPSANGFSPSSPSDSVRTEINTSPYSFPTLVHQLGLLIAAPCNFLQTFLAESIFKNDPCTVVDAARSSGSLLHISFTYTDKNQLQEK